MPGPGACVRLLFRGGSLLLTVNYFFRMTSGKSLRVCADRSRARKFSASNLVMRSSCALTQLVLATLSSATLSSSAAASGSLHDLTGTRIDEKSVSMSDFLGKPVLVLNVASR